MKDFFNFRRMLTPLLIQIIFWLGILVSVFTGVTDMFHGEWLTGLEIVVAGPILVRVFCELLILFFRINETLTDISQSLNKR